MAGHETDVFETLDLEDIVMEEDVEEMRRALPWVTTKHPSKCQAWLIHQHRSQK